MCAMEANPYQSPETETPLAVDPAILVPWRERAWRGAKVGAIAGGFICGALSMMAIGMIAERMPSWSVRVIVELGGMVLVLIVVSSIFSLCAAGVGVLILALFGPRRRRLTHAEQADFKQ